MIYIISILCCIASVCTSLFLYRSVALLEEWFNILDQKIDLVEESNRKKSEQTVQELFAMMHRLEKKIERQERNKKKTSKLWSRDLNEVRDKKSS